ncbi:MAG: aminotransferase DegT [Bacteroidetes bacterium]|nr:MAG: aminotransferase DegT [Bacteroidota bacterium]
MRAFIPISQPSITQKEIDYVTDAVKSGWVSSLGEYINLFEKKFADYCGVEYALTTSNGTAAIHLVLDALGIGPGDEVIIPDFTFIATANAVSYTGATPVLVDIDPVNLCISPSSFESAITDRTKAIVPVHIYGHPADMDAINSIAQNHNILVIEDAAEAIGASINGKMVGGLGLCGTFSFYGNKNITSGEGGMITTNDRELYEHCHALRDHAMSKSKRYWHDEIGFNYRMTNLQAALGCAQMDRVNELVGKRRDNYTLYEKFLGNNSKIRLNRTNDWAVNSYWQVCVEIRGLNLEERDELMAKLKSLGIDSRPYFYPISDMPMYDSVDTPITHDIYQSGICLPTYFDLSEDEIKYVCNSLIELI